MPDNKPLPIFTVEITCSRQWGDAQQVSLDSLLVWSARLHPEAGLKIADAITEILNEAVPGAMRIIAQGGAAALEALGKYQQLSLVQPPDVARVPAPANENATSLAQESAAADSRGTGSNLPAPLIYEHDTPDL